MSFKPNEIELMAAEAKETADEAAAELEAENLLSPDVPATASDPGTAGMSRFDSNYLYVCVAENEWKRAALSTF